MAYRFDAQADSSDDDGVDLSTWRGDVLSKLDKASATITKTATSEGDETSVSAIARPEDVPALPSVENDDLVFVSSNGEAENTANLSESRGEAAEGDDAEEKEVIASNILRTNSAEDSSGSRKRKRGRPSKLSLAPAFTSINKLASPTLSDVQSSKSATAQDGAPGLLQSAELGMLVPMVPRANLDDLSDDVLDFTLGRHVVRKVKREITDSDGDIRYLVEFMDRHIEELPFEELLQYKSGQKALDVFEREGPPPSTPELRPTKMSSTRPGRVRQRPGFVSTADAIQVSDEEVDSERETRRRSHKRKAGRSEYIDEPASDIDEESFSEEETSASRRLRLRNGRGAGRQLRSTQHPLYENDLLAADDEDSDGTPFLDSDIPGNKRRRMRRNGRGPGRPSFRQNDIGYENTKARRQGERQSGRSTRHLGGMQEVGETEIFRSDSDEADPAPVKLKVVAAREVFQDLPRNDEFRMRHIQQCEACGQEGNFAHLIYCQGCTLSYHKSCLGRRSNREHLVTKVDEEFSVFQCRRCIAFVKRRDPTAPDQGKCSDCHKHGFACLPFRPPKTPTQEQKEREDNEGVDPIYPVDPSRINQASNVLFRCLKCWRGFHFEHLPSRTNLMDMETEIDADQRFREYSRDWHCRDCVNAPAKVSGIIAWKPVDEDTYDPAVPLDEIDEEEKAYLVKWDGMSYFRAQWVPGPWVWSVTAHSMRKAFMKRDDSQHPKMRTEDAIPEDYLRTDIVLDIKYTSIVDINTEEIDKARIKEIDKALIKYKGLSYEEAVWEAPPPSTDEDRWVDFVTAYHDWIAGRYIRQPRLSTLKTRLDKARAQDFAKLEKTTQPDNVVGGELMKYQIEGLNWLYFKWYTQKNAILADEMGLGKTIQVIAFLATLVADWNCFPFLVVVPNSTCPNWRREIKRWAPSLRVVAYYGSKESRDLAYRYELFPEGSKELWCHVVVTSYDAAQDDHNRKFFRGVQWQGVIVDEGQRLKNDKNLLYSALAALKCPFRILLTGTPLQNNARELFNLLHFLDESFNAAELEQEYSELDANRITQLHDMIRPFFLRRTKAQVLTFLPPMAQIIVPVSMTIVQKKLYRTILAKNPELMKAIFSSEGSLKQTERGSLNNILMQLRKCLCHPFVYNQSIEDRKVSYSASHRNLVDASAKLKLLELLLPKLKERGHRVLIFSQFLDMLNMVEDFLEGLGLQYQRLDGSIGTLQKQKRIDEFNAPDSPLFAFLLSTRAGGVGINLASADTVIILDPDFNPHQDIQALSRAHRIGQHKKVLCFQLVTRASAEERIMQMGRKKLALDHVLIQEMDADDADPTDLVSVLRHGANELFEDNGDQDVVYDGPSVDRLLDRSHMEDTQAGADKSAETQFSFARVWANDSGNLRDDMVDMAMEEQHAPDAGVWANILRERERNAAEEAAAKADAYGRGRRARGNVDYNGDKIIEGADGLEITPIKGLRTKNGDESDTDFQDDASDDDDPENGEDPLDGEDMALLDGESGAKSDIGRKKIGPPMFKRVIVSQTKYVSDLMALQREQSGAYPELAVRTNDGINCVACRTYHPQGRCPVKLAGVEYCNLCGMAHFGSARVCPHIQSETQVRLMQEALKLSNEPEHLVTEARRYLRGLKGNLVQMKKQAEAKKHAAREAQKEATFQQARGPIWQAVQAL